MYIAAFQWAAILQDMTMKLILTEKQDFLYLAADPGHCSVVGDEDSSSQDTWDTSSLWKNMGKICKDKVWQYLQAESLSQGRERIRVIKL